MLNPRFRSSARREFNRAVKRYFSPRFSLSKQQGLLLVEVINNAPHQIALVHLVKALTRNRALKVVAFVDPANTSLNRRQAFQRSVVFRMNSWSPRNVESTYSALGARGLIYPSPSKSQKFRAIAAADEFFARNPTKLDVEDYRLEGILVGDLVYDDYLLKLQQGTIIPESPEFREHFTESLKVFYFWMDYFSNSNVRAVVGNSVYRQGLVARIAIANGCDAFDPQVSRVVRLRGDGFQYEDTREYRATFEAIPDKEAALQVSREFLALKKQGKPDLSTAHLDTGKRSQQKILGDGDGPRILIAPHAFSDSAHSYGKMLFPDFHEWLTFLASVAETSPYNWYLKPHPKGLKDLPMIREIFSSCSNMTILEVDSSLDQIGEEGVDVALTMRGHVVLDFALMGIPVISCTPGFRYRNYGFNVAVDNKSEFREYLLDVGSIPNSIDQDEVLEFYYMDMIFNHPNIFFPDLLEAQEQVRDGGPEEILRVFADSVGQDFIEDTLNQLQRFVQSGELRFRRAEDL